MTNTSGMFRERTSVRSDDSEIKQLEKMLYRQKGTIEALQRQNQNQKDTIADLLKEVKTLNDENLKLQMRLSRVNSVNDMRCSNG